MTEKAFTEANNNVILQAFHTVKPSSLTPTPREFINFVEQFLALGRLVRDRITQRQAKDRILDVIATMKVDGSVKEIIQEETKVGLEYNYLEMIIFVINPLMSRHKLAIKKGHIMRRLGHAIQESPQPKPWTPLNQVNPQRTGNKNGPGWHGRSQGHGQNEDPEGHQDEDQADPELSIAEIQEICEAQVLAMSGRAGAGASSIPKCPACGNGRHSREDCLVLHPHKAPTGSRKNSNPRKLGSAAKRSPLRKEVAKEKDHTKVGSFRLARAAGARCIRQRIVGRSIRICGRKPRSKKKSLPCLSWGT